MSMQGTTVLSPLRYPGGKSKVSGKIARLLPEFSEYREPFIGGGSVFLAAAQANRSAKFWINDLYPEVANFWKQAQISLPAMVEAVREIKGNFRSGVELYEFLKDWGPHLDVDGAVRFFILNRITFSGTSDSGGFSQQAFDKRFTDSSLERLEGLDFLSTLDLAVTNEDYEECLKSKGDDVSLFLDPPYRTKDRRLYGKWGNLHRSFDHERFSEVVKACGHKWMVTYNQGLSVEDMLPESENVHYMRWEQHYGMKNALGASVPRGKELIITNYSLGVEKF